MGLKYATLLEQSIHKCGFAVVDVCDNGDVSDIHGTEKGALLYVPEGKKAMRNAVAAGVYFVFVRFHPLFPGFLAACIIGGWMAISGSVSDSSLPKTQVLAEKAASSSLEEESSFVLLAVGDIMLSRFVAVVAEKNGGLSYPFAKTKEWLQGADLTFANLENPVAPGKKMPAKGLSFRAAPESAEALKEAGIDIVSLANNHMTDAGEGAVSVTRSLLEGAGILFVGAGTTEEEARRPVFVTVKGKTIAFLAYGESRFKNQVHFADEKHAGIALASKEHFAEDIAAARAQADIVIVSLHAGAEYRPKPDAIQQELARSAIDAGADLVLGHHPHVVQPVERYKEKFIVYSLGNFIFDQNWSRETSESAMLRIHFTGTTVTHIEGIPIVIENDAQPRILSGSRADAILQRMELALP